MLHIRDQVNMVQRCSKIHSSGMQAHILLTCFLTDHPILMDFWGSNDLGPYSIHDHFKFHGKLGLNPLGATNLIQGLASSPIDFHSNWGWKPFLTLMIANT
jgi:hypothetical protein